MPAFTRISIKALDELGGPRIVLAAIPGGARALAQRAGVSQSRVSQILRQDPLPWDWAQMIASLIPCQEWEVYAQLGQSVSGVVTANPDPVSKADD
jgi:hypothetical protein